jgi:hypothetical protein
MDAQFMAWVEPGQQATGGTINVYAFHHATQSFMLVATVPVTTDEQLQTTPLPGNASQWREAGSGMTRLRLEFVPNQNRRTRLAIDVAHTNDRDII